MTTTELGTERERSINLDAYFRRIGYTNPPAPDLATLGEIVVRHTQRIPFENLDPLLGRPVKLDARSLDQKMVHGGRGGYCFEQNLLLKHVLEAVGFPVVGLAARILWDRQPGVVTPRGHMLLSVEVEGDRYIVDVGFGVLTLTAPLRLTLGVEQSTPHEAFRIFRGEGEDFLLQAKLQQRWKPLYRFDLREHHVSDYEITNWYLSNHPKSGFLRGLMAARAAPGRRYTLRDTKLSVYTSAGATERRTLRSVMELRGILKDIFRITMPSGITSTLERLVAGGGSSGLVHVPNGRGPK